MKFKTLLFAGCGLVLMHTASAQTPAAPQGATGMCRDGTYSEAASKRGACAGHKGVKDWYAADSKSGPAAPPSASAGAPVPATAAPSAPVKPTRVAAAPPAINGQVWVNSNSKVYHCQGDRYYGKTKAGSYMSESEAKAAGNHADHGKPCAS